MTDVLLFDLAVLLCAAVCLPCVSHAVVGENVMLQVATSDMIVGPTRLLFPRAPGGVGEAADFPFSLLGLGDIAIPGEQGFNGGTGEGKGLGEERGGGQLQWGVWREEARRVTF